MYLRRADELIAPGARAKAPAADGIGAAERELQVLRQGLADLAGLEGGERERGHAVACRQVLEPAAVGNERPGSRVPDGVVNLPLGPGAVARVGRGVEGVERDERSERGHHVGAVWRERHVRGPGVVDEEAGHPTDADSVAEVPRRAQLCGRRALVIIVQRILTARVIEGGVNGPRARSNRGRVDRPPTAVSPPKSADTPAWAP